jgi:geranylgeranyl diphosphate synthase type II
MTDYSQSYNKYLTIFNGYLEEIYSQLDKSAPKIIIDAMRYAVSGGGKRIRPVLCLATAESLGVPFESVKEYCVAIETIHSYSLVHDDLPAMDNDDYRRGKLSTHKKFGEANGILIGDALLNFAFEHALSSDNFNQNSLKAMRVLADFAGYRGMIGGQVYDLQSENKQDFSEKDLYLIYENKTAKLITAPLLIASELSGGLYKKELSDFGYNLGVLFQIIDDIMDVEGTLESIGKTPHKDEEENKLTSIKIFGLDGAKERAKMHYDACKKAISNIPDSWFLSQLADAMYVRRK